MRYSFTSVEGLRSLSEKLKVAISKLEFSIENVEIEANRIMDACQTLNAYNGANSRSTPRKVIRTNNIYYYKMKWNITGQEAIYERASATLDELEEVKASLNEQFQKVAKMVANIGEEIASDENAIEALLGNIAYSKYGAANHQFIDRKNILENDQVHYWTDDKLEFDTSVGNGAVLITKAGVPMGFTTINAYNNYIQAKTNSNTKSGGPYVANPRVITNDNIKTKAEERETAKYNAWRAMHPKEESSSSNTESSTSNNTNKSPNAETKKKVAKAASNIPDSAKDGHKASTNTNKQTSNAYVKNSTKKTTSSNNVTTGAKAVETKKGQTIYNITDKTVSKAKKAGVKLTTSGGAYESSNDITFYKSGYRDKDGRYISIIDKNGEIYAVRDDKMSGLPTYIKNNDFKTKAELDKMYMKGKGVVKNAEMFERK